MGNMRLMGTLLLAVSLILDDGTQACFQSLRESQYSTGMPFRLSLHRSNPDVAHRQSENNGDQPVVVSGDIVTDRSQFAYLARILKLTTGGKDLGCTGSIISSRVVLTAGHCVDQTTRLFGKYNKYAVTVGDLVNSDTNEGSGTREVTVKGRATAHPNYPSTSSAVDPYDIAVITLERSLTFNTFVQPIALASSSYTVTDGTRATIAGWGVYQSGGTETSDNLRSGTVTVYRATQARCGSSSINHVCSIPTSTGTRQIVCYGDSGGPHMQLVGGIKTLIGVSSYVTATGCPTSASGGAIAVAPFVSWISQYTG